MSIEKYIKLLNKAEIEQRSKLTALQWNGKKKRNILKFFRPWIKRNIIYRLSDAR
jgi:hypothetical protein